MTRNNRTDVLQIGGNASVVPNGSALPMAAFRHLPTFFLHPC